ncbi:hypothetical protein WJX74_003746 [Apatococcus lobatus]|uniref:Uncharacterized protein n=1 Tax=Apatococcus lobatus TaxID=904363 RepID=A0AAW1S765_9CHLO
MPRVRTRKQPCDCDRCVDEPLEELFPFDPALTRSLVVLVTGALISRTGCDASEHQQQHLDRVVRDGSSGKVYFSNNQGLQQNINTLLLPTEVAIATVSRDKPSKVPSVANAARLHISVGGISNDVDINAALPEVPGIAEALGLTGRVTKDSGSLDHAVIHLSAADDRSSHAWEDSLANVADRLSSRDATHSQQGHGPGPASGPASEAAGCATPTNSISTQQPVSETMRASVDGLQPQVATHSQQGHGRGAEGSPASRLASNAASLATSTSSIRPQQPASAAMQDLGEGPLETSSHSPQGDEPSADRYSALRPAPTPASRPASCASPVSTQQPASAAMQASSGDYSTQTATPHPQADVPAHVSSGSRSAAYANPADSHGFRGLASSSLPLPFESSPRRSAIPGLQVDERKADSSPAPRSALHALPASHLSAQQPASFTLRASTDQPHPLDQQVQEDPTADWVPSHAVADGASSRSSHLLGDEHPVHLSTAQQHMTLAAQHGALVWVDGLLGALDNYPAVSKHLLISLVIRSGHNQLVPGPPVLAVDAAEGRDKLWMSKMRPTQSFQIVDGREVDVGDLQPARFIQCLPHVVRCDHLRDFSSDEWGSTGGLGAIHARHLLPEIAFRLGLAPKYGA